MALNYKKQKNLIRSPDEYTRYYGDFRGVDFSSDHTEVHDQRLAYAINMYKDYRTGEGNAIETVPGFRKRFQAPRVLESDGSAKFDAINGIHEFSYVAADGTRDKDVLVHAGKYLYLWDNYSASVNVLQESTIQLLSELDVGKAYYKIAYIVMDGSTYTSGFYQIGTSLVLEANFGNYSGKTLYIYYYDTHEAELAGQISSLPDQYQVADAPAFVRTLPQGISKIVDVKTDGGKYDSNFEIRDGKITFYGALWWNYYGQNVTLRYYEKEQSFDDAIKGAKGEAFEMNDAESKSFAFNNRLYIIDGTQFLVYYKNGDNSGFTLERVDKSAGNYVPTTYRNLGVGAISPEEMSKYEYEQKNLLCDYFKHTYVAGKAKGESGAEQWVSEYPLYDNDEVYSVAVNDVTLKENEYSVAKGKITFNTAPTIPSDKPETYAGVVITYTKREKKDENGNVIYSATLDRNKINKCTICATFDKRVFLTGNPDYPNHIWYCGYNNLTGYEDAAYFGELDYVIDGVENAPITGLIPVGDTLAAIKNHTRQDGSVYFHTRLETNAGVIPVSYPSEPGLSGIGCLGACINFLDDPIFISRLGVEGIEKMAVNLERSIAHRSSLIDAKLVNLNLENARLTEWDGYLVVLVDGKMFLADSRQRYTHTTGVAQYEWYYLEDIGIYEGQVTEYYYAPVKYSYVPDTIEIGGTTYETDLATHIYDVAYTKSENLLYTAVKDETGESDASAQVKEITVQDSDGTPHTLYCILKYTWDGVSYQNNGTPDTKTKAIICEDYGSYTGGEFYEAKKVVNIDENIFFGTDNGIVCSFNFDMKNADGTISPKYYTFNERTIYCGIATKMDNCGIPHLTKSTIKKSTVIKTKSMIKSAAKVRVRTNNKGYESVSRVNSRVFSFDNVDFSDFSFVSTDQTIFAVKEKEKHWVEKQHWIYSDEFQCPFSVHYLAFRYKVSGRIKG